MAGANHHIIPRFFLKHFASRETSKSKYTWLIRSGADPVEINIDSATERYFYGVDDEGVDPEITKREKDYAALLDDLVFAHSKVNSTELLLEFIVHIAVRTKNTRVGFHKHAVAKYDEKSAPLLSDFSAYASKLMAEQPNLLIEAFMKQQNIEANDENKKLVSYLLGYAISRQKNILNQSASVAGDAIQQLRYEINDENIKQAHISALKRTNVSPDKKQKSLEGLVWRVQVFEDYSVVIGDVAVWCIDSESGYSAPMPLILGRKVEFIYMPISHNKVLIGSRENLSPRFDITWINHVSVGLSEERFYSPINPLNESALAAQIGSLSCGIWE